MTAYVTPITESESANRGRGMMKTSRNIQKKWCSMAVLIAVAAVMLVALIAPALALAGAGNIIGPDGTDDYGKVTADEFKPFIILG